MLVNHMMCSDVIIMFSDSRSEVALTVVAESAAVSLLSKFTLTGVIEEPASNEHTSTLPNETCFPASTSCLSCWVGVGTGDEGGGVEPQSFGEGEGETKNPS